FPACGNAEHVYVAAVSRVERHFIGHKPIGTFRRSRLSAANGDDRREDQPDGARHGALDTGKNIHRRWGRTEPDGLRWGEAHRRANGTIAHWAFPGRREAGTIIGCAPGTAEGAIQRAEIAWVAARERSWRVLHQPVRLTSTRREGRG